MQESCQNGSDDECIVCECPFLDERVTAYNDSMLDFLKYSSNLGRERLLASSNILMVVISFCFVAEATLFASEVIIDALRRAPLCCLSVALLLTANLQLVLSLWFAMKAPGRMVAVSPVVTDCVTDISEDALCEKLIVEQFSMVNAMMDCVRLARAHVNLAQNITFVAILDFLVATLVVLVGDVGWIDRYELGFVIAVVAINITVSIGMLRKLPPSMRKRFPNEENPVVACAREYEVENKEKLGSRDTN